MIHPSTRKLIDRLHEMTLQSRIDWAEGDEGAIIYDTEGYRVTLTDGPKEIRLSDTAGKELETVSEEALAATMTDEGQSYADLMASMHLEAGRIARGTELAISKVLAGLDLDGDGIPDVDIEAEDDVASEETTEAETDMAEAAVAEDSIDIDEAEIEVADETVDADEGQIEAEPTDPALDDEVASMTAEVSKLADEVNGSEATDEADAGFEDEPAGDGEPDTAAFAGGFGLATAAVTAATDIVEDAVEESGIEDAAEEVVETVTELAAEAGLVTEEVIEDTDTGAEDGSVEEAEAPQVITLSGLAPLHEELPVAEETTEEVSEGGEAEQTDAAEPEETNVSPFASVETVEADAPDAAAAEADISGQTIGEGETPEADEATDEPQDKPKFNPWL